MSTAGEIIKTVLDVDCAGDNWANLTRKPSICLIGVDDVIQASSPNPDVIFIKEEDGGHESTLNRVPIFTKDNCTVRIVMSNRDDRENAFADIVTMFENASSAIVIRPPYKRDPIRMDLFTMNLNVEVSNI